MEGFPGIDASNTTHTYLASFVRLKTYTQAHLLPPGTILQQPAPNRKILGMIRLIRDAVHHIRRRVGLHQNASHQTTNKSASERNRSAPEVDDQEERLR